MKRILRSLVIAFSMVAGVGTLNTATVYAGDPTEAARRTACEGLQGTGAACGGSSGNSLERVIKALLRVLSLVAGILAVIMIIVAGMKYITSGGDAQSVAGAKRTLIYAIVGLIVAALAQIIVRYVLKQV